MPLLRPQAGLLSRVGAAAGPRHREREGADPLGRGEREVLGDRAAERGAEDVEALEPQRVGEPERVGGHVGDLVGPVGIRALPDVAVVEDDPAVAGGERLELERPGQVVGREAHDAEQRLTLPVLLVVQGHPVGVGEWHAPGG